MREGQKVQILPSQVLTELKLDELSARTGTVMEVIVNQGKIKGCWVLLDGQPYMEEAEWYIPYISLIEL